MSNKCIPFTKEQHAEFGKDLKEATDLLSPYVEKIWKAYGVHSKESKALLKAMKLLTSEMCCSMDCQWYKIIDNDTSHMENPYYGAGIKHY